MDLKGHRDPRGLGCWTLSLPKSARDLTHSLSGALRDLCSRGPVHAFGPGGQQWVKQLCRSLLYRLVSLGLSGMNRQNRTLGFSAPTGVGSVAP